MDPKTEITDLTICRALFAAWVFVYHVDLYVDFSAWLGPFSGLIRHGYLGVDGFFILSGFVLAQVHPELSAKTHVTMRAQTVSEPVNFKAILIFWGKRLARIYPVHLVTLLLLGAIYLAGSAHGLAPRDPAHFTLASFAQNIFLVQGWGVAGQGAWNYPSWSVSTEWAGYLLFPLLWYLITYFEWYVALQFVIAGFCIMGLIVLRLGPSLNLTFAFGLIRFFPEFILGMCMVRFVYIVADAGWFRAAARFGGLACILLGACAGFDLLSLFGLWFFLFALIMQADAHLPPVMPLPFLRRLGLLSYAFYMSFALAELLVAQGFRHAGLAPARHGFIFVLSMLALTMAIAIVLHVAVERPCRRRIDSWLAGAASQ